MQAQLPQRTLLSLALSLLFLSMAQARGRCSSSSPQLLRQLQSQANMTGNTESLLEPYVHLQNLNTPDLRNACTKDCPSAFPSEDALQAMSKPLFLSTVYATLDRVGRQLGTLRYHFLNIEDFPHLERARQNIGGIKNNVYCMAWLLNHSLEIPEPTQENSGSSPPTTITSKILETRLETCRFLCGYHRFMVSVGKVFREWGDSSIRSRRHSPLRARHKGARRIRASGAPCPGSRCPGNLRTQ
ncbi:oncostatin-M [Acomys russatus]|uniref:oncostatin-M n=1 Tax=Acomys russatus TaxID=60746 RepID=UPI0021E32FDE|nr:oncostatin-M [Acomys russatus]